MFGCLRLVVARFLRVVSGFSLTGIILVPEPPLLDHTHTSSEMRLIVDSSRLELVTIVRERVSGNLQKKKSTQNKSKQICCFCFLIKKKAKLNQENNTQNRTHTAPQSTADRWRRPHIADKQRRLDFEIFDSVLFCFFNFKEFNVIFVCCCGIVCLLI